jgi:hypothetical protein
LAQASLRPLELELERQAWQPESSPVLQQQAFSRRALQRAWLQVLQRPA